ncbi:rRNA-processing protein utp21, variant 2 [Balamuthia mandrillaris]
MTTKLWLACRTRPSRSCTSTAGRRCCSSMDMATGLVLYSMTTKRQVPLLFLSSLFSLLSLFSAPFSLLPLLSSLLLVLLLLSDRTDIASSLPKKVVSCSGDHSVRVWNWDGKCVYRTRKHTGWVKRLQYTQELLATGSGDSTVKLWRWSPGWKYMPKDSEEHNEQDDTCDDGELQENAKERSSLLPTTKRDEPLPIPKCVRTLAGHQQGIMGLQFDRNTLVSSSLRGNIRVWDIESGKCLHEINAPSELRCVAFDENDIGSFSCSLFFLFRGFSFSIFSFSLSNIYYIQSGRRSNRSCDCVGQSNWRAEVFVRWSYRLRQVRAH